MLQSKFESKCCGAKMTVEDVGIITHKERYVSLGLCPDCRCFCSVVEIRAKSSSKILHAALKLLHIIYKGIIITIVIIFLLPFFLIVLMITHVIKIDDKIKLIPILRIRDDLSINVRTE